MPRVRLLPILCVLTSCAATGGGAGPGTAPPERVVTSVRGAEIVVLHDAVDVGTAAEIARALPGAVSRAGRWGALRSATIVVHGSERRFREAVGATGRSSLRAWTRQEVVHLRDPRAWGRAGASTDELVDVLAHELVHCAMYQRIDGSSGRGPVPFWFREGMAMELLEREQERALRARLHALEARRLARAGESAVARASALLPDHPDVAYAIAYVAFRTLVARQGETVVGRILDRMRAGEAFDAAFVAGTGMTLGAFDAAVRRAIDEGR